MDQVYKNIAWKFVVVYLDDTIIYSRTFNDHLKHLREVFLRIRKAGLKLNLEKCQFWMQRLPFLGHIITPQGIGPDPGKVEAIKKLIPPRNVSQLRSFLGLARYYRKFIRNFSEIARPLNKLLKKEQLYDWKRAQDEAFDTLK